MQLKGQRDLSNLGVHRFCGELVPALSLLIIEQHHPVHSANSELDVVWCPCHAGNFGSKLLWRQGNKSVLKHLFYRLALI